MKLPLKPHLLVLLCSVGLFAASGVMFVKSRATEPAAPAPVAQQPSAPAPAPIAAPAPADQTAPVVAPTYSAAQIDQWVAPIALYPDSLLSQILMASTYPANRNGDNNININVDNFNKISGQRLTDANRTWQHNPAYREGVPYPNNQLNNRFHATNTATGLSSTQQRPVNRDSQRQAAMSQMEKSTGKTFPQTARTGTKDAQRQASSQQLKQISQRNNYRGYDTKPQTAKRTSTQQRENRQAVAQRQEKRVTQPAQQRNLQQRTSQPRANALSGNDSRSANWQAQQQRGAQSRQVARNQPSRQPSGGRAEHREFRHR